MVEGIQILRVLSVLGVFVFHLSPSALPNGYLGVDLFFLISGFVICLSCLKGADRGAFSVGGFLLKRMWRLAPSYLAVVFLVLVYSYFFSSTMVFLSVFEAAPFSVLSISNWFFAFKSDYFALNDDLNPLVHTWSLSVEEQFYVCFPFLFLYRKRTKCMVGVIGCVSLLLFFLLEDRFAYFLPFCRCWQFLFGVLLGWFFYRYDLRCGRWGLVVSLVLIVITFYLDLDREVLTVLVSLVCLPAVFCVRAGINNFWMLLGRSSYSIYLVHWPVICFVKQSDLSMSMVVLLVVLFTSIFSFIVFRLFDGWQSKAAYPYFKQHHTWFGYCFVLLLISCLASMLLSVSYCDESDGRYTEGYFPRSLGGSGGLESLFDRNSSVDCVLIGDSHGYHYSKLVERYSESRNLRYLPLYGGGYMLRGREVYIFGHDGAVRESSLPNHVEYIREEIAFNRDVEFIFIALRLDHYFYPAPELDGVSHRSVGARLSGVREAMESNYTVLGHDIDLICTNNPDSVVVLLGQVPMLDRYPVDSDDLRLFKFRFRGESVEFENGRRELVLKWVKESLQRNPNLRFFDPEDVIDSPFASNGRGLYRDDDHLNFYGREWFSRFYELLNLQ